MGILLGQVAPKDPTASLKRAPKGFEKSALSDPWISLFVTLLISLIRSIHLHWAHGGKELARSGARPAKQLPASPGPQVPHKYAEWQLLSASQNFTIIGSKSLSILATNWIQASHPPPQPHHTAPGASSRRHSAQLWRSWDCGSRQQLRRSPASAGKLVQNMIHHTCIC